MMALVTSVYGSATPEGWTSWMVRNWDYGGCSAFGSGLHQKLLAEAQALLAPPARFRVEVEPIRAQILQDIFNEESTFPSCDIKNPNTPTPKEKLAAEAKAILDSITLSAEEKAKLQARITAGFPLTAIGG